MIIKRYGIIDISEWYVTISRNTDNNRNINSLPVYFDAAFSRKVVEQRVIEGGYTMVKEFYTKDVSVPELNILIIVYDPNTISKEKGYEELNQYLSKKNDNIVVFKGRCECSYDIKDESIKVIIQTKEKIV